MEQQFAEMIQTCRSAFHRWRRHPLTKLGLRSHQVGIDDAHNDKMRQAYLELMKAGDVVWGALSQVNSKMFESGQDDLPGVMVYSPDHAFDGQPQDLREISRACFELKNTKPELPELCAIADELTNEFSSTPRLKLSDLLTGQRSVFLGTTMFHRNRLPTRLVSASVLPLVVAPEVNEFNMILPLKFWPNTLIAQWQDFDTLIDEMPVYGHASEVAARADKAEMGFVEADWDLGEHPVKLMPNMIHWMRTQAPGLIKANDPILFVCLDENGEKTMDLVVGDDDHPQRALFTYEGIRIQLLKSQVEQLRGTRVDYQDNAYGVGLVIRLPGE